LKNVAPELFILVYVEVWKKKLKVKMMWSEKVVGKMRKMKKEATSKMFILF